jgi:hypothetical protein
MCVCVRACYEYIRVCRDYNLCRHQVYANLYISLFDGMKRGYQNGLCIRGKQRLFQSVTACK